MASNQCVGLTFVVFLVLSAFPCMCATFPLTFFASANNIMNNDTVAKDIRANGTHATGTMTKGTIVSSTVADGTWTSGTSAQKTSTCGFANGVPDCDNVDMGSCGVAGGVIELDPNAYQVCVTQLPPSVSSTTGQGPSSDKLIPQPWCIRIWSYSNSILQNKVLQLECESIPSRVLEGQYSLDKYAQCGSMSSTDGCGVEDIRRCIEGICRQCHQQTGDEASQIAVEAKCDAILAKATNAPLQQLRDAGSLSLPRKGGEYFFGLFIAGIIAGVSAFVLWFSSRNPYGDWHSNGHWGTFESTMYG